MSAISGNRRRLLAREGSRGVFQSLHVAGTAGVAPLDVGKVEMEDRPKSTKQHKGKPGLYRVTTGIC